ncbi:MAG: sulfite exporter TauE/SafE family protein, partial [Planctomycetes bacterium]|nr:sulfite exporter TauE/SafE family protein [Planctomycetota bacterium]
MPSEAPSTDPIKNVKRRDAAWISGLAATLSTMLGIGGGSVMVPLLGLVAKVPLKRAAGSSLVVIVVAVSIGLALKVYFSPEEIDWPVAGVLASGAFAGAFIGRWLNTRLPEGVFKYAFCVLLFLVSLRMFGLGVQSGSAIFDTIDMSRADVWAILGVVGLLAGITSAMFGIGGGIVFVPGMALVFDYFGENFGAAGATSLAAMLPTVIVGSILHYRAKNIDTRLVLTMLPLSIVGAAMGVFLASEVDKAVLKKVFAILVTIAAVRLSL